MTVTWGNLVQFFLNDFSQDGRDSYSGYDVRAYLFSVMNASTLINIQNEEI